MHTHIHTHTHTHIDKAFQSSFLDHLPFIILPILSKLLQIITIIIKLIHKGSSKVRGWENTVQLEGDHYHSADIAPSDPMNQRMYLQCDFDGKLFSVC